VTVVRLTARPGAVTRAIAAVRRHAEVHGLVDDVADRLVLVAEEWVVNILDHSGAAPRSWIVLMVSGAGGRLRLTISDAGRPFDPSTVRDISPNLERGGGAGIALIRTWCEMTYARRGGRNRLVLDLR
jgi:anti-sigma regulatory factor (Ser/Thr protein kinase)